MSVHADSGRADRDSATRRASEPEGTSAPERNPDDPTPAAPEPDPESLRPPAPEPDPESLRPPAPEPDPESLRPPAPEPEFAITGAGHVAFSAAPTMLFSATATDPSGLPIQSIALSAQVMIDAARRGYDDATRDRLAELFGPPAGWAPSTQGLAWARVSAHVASFRSSTMFSLELPCTYDLEVAAAKYFYALGDGDVPLSFHFNGNVFYLGPRGRLQVVPVSWSNTAQFRMPVAAWRQMIAEHYPGGGWIRVQEHTLAALNDRRAARGLPSFDACLAELLERDEPGA